MNYLRDDAPVKADMLVLGARLPRKEEIPVNPTPKRISAAVMQDETGKMFTAIERRDFCATTGDLNNPEVMAQQMPAFDYETFYQEMLLQPAKAFYAEFVPTLAGADMRQGDKIFDFKCDGTWTRSLSGKRADTLVIDDILAVEKAILGATEQRSTKRARKEEMRRLHATRYGAPL